MRRISRTLRELRITRLQSGENVNGRVSHPLENSALARRTLNFSYMHSEVGIRSAGCSIELL
jgi:hypothetical protein